MTPLHQEKQKTYAVFYILLIAELPLMLYVIILGISQKEYGPTILVTAIMALLVFALVNFFWMNLKIYDDKLVAYFGIFHLILKYTDIKSIAVEPYNFKKYWGYGIRWAFDNSRAWVTRSGLGLKIKTTKYDYFISCHEPEKVRAIIQTKIK